MLEELKSKILKYMQRYPQSITSRGLIKKLKVKDTKSFYQALNQLRDAGAVDINKKHRVRIYRSQRGLLLRVRRMAERTCLSTPTT